eukprot:TRINITY_DN422_c4_g1_i1.p1 TRINITY_DN422_c4_g1~~TRINITY_DN422_c4_g1_i1.p1  ORF type:complete len:306 (-),score=35.19 TRINITY_DN422_c4_g1_i1:128-961(-)
MCCSEQEAVRVMQKYKLGIISLVVYILLAFFLIDTYLWTTFALFTHPTLLYFLNLLGVLALSSLYQSHRANPGYLLDEDWDSNLPPSAMSEWGLCSRCKLTTPARAFHCYQIEKCILRYDHHCPYADAPIGFFNYKYYLLLLTYGCLSTALIMFLCLITVFVYLIHHGVSWEAFYAIPLTTWPLLLATMAVLGGLVPLTQFHVNLVRLNLSTKEYFVWKRENDQKEPETSKWDLGFLENLKQVMGPSYASWWNPFTHGPVIEGVHFPYSPAYEAKRQ